MESNELLFLGVDPGFKGALCVTKIDGTVYMLDTPLKTTTAGRPEIDALKIVEFIKPHAAHLRLATIEQVSAMPGNGVASMFRFGFGAGLVHGILAGLGAEKILNPPAAVWKLKMGLTHNKSDSIELALKTANAKYHHLFKLKKHDGRAEALLLAIFGMRSLGLEFGKGNLGEISELF